MRFKIKKAFTPTPKNHGRPPATTAFQTGESAVWGFTLVEILIVIAIIIVLAAIVFISIDPARRFAQARNAQRWIAANSISQSTQQYIIDNQSYPSGLDSTLRMIGTASSGCAVSCGESISSADAFNGPHYVNNLIISPASAAEAKKPIIIAAKINPLKVRLGDEMIISVFVRDEYGIKSVVADMGGIETIELGLKKGSKYEGTWQASWQVHDTGPQEYQTIIRAVNELNLSSQTYLIWSDPGWVLPTNYEDPGNQWSNEPKIYDDNIGTYAQNTYGSAGWGQFIVLDLAEPINSDRVRVNADYLDAHIQEVDVDVLKDGIWKDVFQGGNEAQWNCKWVELAFSEGSVSKARFRYNYRVGGYYYWLYEFQFYQKAATITLPSVSTYAVSSVGESQAILHGTLADDGGEPCEYRFQYGKTTSYGDQTSWQGGKIIGENFSDLISGLEKDTKYHFRAQARNSAGIASGLDEEFTTQQVGTGWITPTGYSDSDNQWENETAAYNDNLMTAARSYHNIGSPQWSSFFYFNLPAMSADKIRFYARGGNEVSSVDIDVFEDGVWQDVYEASFADKSWVEKDFNEGIVTQSRIRFYASSASTGFYWELYEFNFLYSSETSSDACLNLNSALVPKYLSNIPYDPKDGSSEKTYYAIKKTPAGVIIVKACKAESGEIISAAK